MSSRIPILIIISLVLALQPHTHQAARVSSMGAVDHRTSWNGAKEIPSRKMFESFMENFAQMTRNQDAWRVGSQVRLFPNGKSTLLDLVMTNFPTNCSYSSSVPISSSDLVFVKVNISLAILGELPQHRSPSSGISVMKRCAGLSTCILPILSERLYRNGVLRTHVGVNSPGKRRRALPALPLP